MQWSMVGRPAWSHILGEKCIDSLARALKIEPNRFSNKDTWPVSEHLDQLITVVLLEFYTFSSLFLLLPRVLFLRSKTILEIAEVAK